MKKVKTAMNYDTRMHLIGRIWVLSAIILFAAVPITLCIYFDASPDWGVFASAAIIIPLIINFGSGILEPIIYAPMLGINGEYLAFITGNLSNMKIPCVVKSQEIAGTKMGTEENELVSTIAIATSTLVTVIVVAVFVLCLGVSNLEKLVNDNPFITPAFSCVVYALFGSLGGKYIAKNPKLAIFPAIVIVAISAILGVVGMNAGSAYLIVGIAICLLFAVYQFMREKKRMRVLEEKRRLEAIAAGISYESNVAIEKSWEAEAAAAKRKGESIQQVAAQEIEEAEAAIENEIVSEISDASESSDNNNQE